MQQVHYADAVGVQQGWGSLHAADREVRAMQYAGLQLVEVYLRVAIEG
jgi:hypothetical protein